MRVLIACEFSGTVREAFRKRGHDAWSCDLLPALDESEHHIQADVKSILHGCGLNPRFNTKFTTWDMMIAHPPCTHLAVSGARWFKDKKKEQEEALEFVKMLMDAPIPRICIENPVSIISSRIRKPDQIIQPYMFGHTETKKTCLWLKNLPPLKETNNVYDEMMKLPVKERNKIHYMSPSKDRGYLRSITYTGIAEAMASQWSSLDVKD